MAPAKRRRTLDDVGDAENAEAGDELANGHPARLEAKHSKRKRSKIARAQERGGSVVSDEEPDSDDAYGEDHRQNDRGYDDDREDAEDSEDERELLEQAQEDLKISLRKHKENQAAEYGVIEEVYCQNFMCHSKLRIKLGPLINFIIGHNGSGKSAVLTALTLCLGVKATATNRGGSLKKFIKEGQDSAILSVKIKNGGDLAYQPDMYGDSITVERHFNRGGASQFKIKSAEGRIITTKKAELEDMLDYLGLQLDNPLNVLSQDLARQFLSASTPNDKYKFFMKGTQLEQLDRDYRMIHDFVDQSDAKCANREEDISHLKRRMEQAAAKKKQMDNVGTLRQRINEISWQHAWAQVEGVEKALENAQKDVDKAEEQLERRREQAQAKSDEYDTKDQNVLAARGVIADLKVELEPLEASQNTAKEDFDKGKAELQNNVTNMRHIKSDANSHKKDIDACKGKIEEEEMRIEAASGSAQADKLRELRDAEADAIEKRKQHAQQDSRELEQARQAAQQELDTRNSELRPVQERLTEAERRMATLRNDQGDNMRAYDQNMPNLLRAIQHETRFQTKPVGPLGMHVKLKKPEWSSQVESIFGGALDSFVVLSARDQGILRELQQKCRCFTDIYIGSGRRLDVTNQQAVTDEDTLLSILDIDNDLVRNQFIINQSAEQTIMVRSRAKASSLMDAANRPRNVKAAVSMHDRIRGEGHRFTTTLSGKSVGRVRPWTRGARMKTDVEAQVRNQQEIIDEAKRAVDTSRQAVRAAQIKLKEANEAIKRFERRQRELKIAYQQADDQVTQLKEELERFTIEAGSLDALKAQLAEAEESERLAINSLADAGAEKDNINAAQRERKRVLEEAQEAVQEIETRIKKVEASLLKHDSSRQTALREKNLAIANVELAEKVQQESEAKVVEERTRLAEFTDEASKVCNRIPVPDGMDADKLDRKLEQAMKDRERAEAAVGLSQEEVVQQWATAREEYRKAELGLREIHLVVRKLKKVLMVRKERWTWFRKEITIRARIMFAHLLGERGFKGRVIADHRLRELDIAVEPDTTQQSDRGRQAKTLSGGEKSFSTICLLLSIWEAMGSPIRCLDEFDVFMDNVNRDTSMKMMIEAARRAVGKQYILITPQSMGNVAVKDDMRIHKMSDPERGQTTITF